MRKKVSCLRTVISVLALSLLLTSSASAQGMAKGEKSLYERLGGFTWAAT